MTKLLLKNIRNLYGAYATAPHVLRGKEMNTVSALPDAWLACEDGLVAEFGSMQDFPGISDWKDLRVVDCGGKDVMPAFVDSHTHIVYAANREQEFADRLNGLSYEEIAARGGGIINSVMRLRTMSEDELYERALERLYEVIMQGTGGIEIKSGYGLDLENELKMLRVIRRLKNLNIIPVKSTFLGAHALPPEYKNNRQGYLKLVTDTILPEVAEQGLADFVDIFCERNYFTSDETFTMLEAAAKYDIKGKVHAEQLSHTGGIAAGVKANAISVDHLEYCSDTDIELLLQSDVIPTVLPGAAFFLDLPRPPARKMIDAGLPVAFASDYNPGTSPTGNMKLMMSMASVLYKLTAEEAFNSVTINSAAACGLGHLVGTITPGKLANFLITKPGASYVTMNYGFGSNQIEEVYLNGLPFNSM